MTVRQHAPRLEQVRPPLVVPTGLFVAIGLILVIALVGFGLWLLLAPGTTPGLDGGEVMEKLHRLRETIPGGGFI